jgi:pimeloyl-ACP methyl ester carboxylesterase
MRLRWLRWLRAVAVAVLIGLTLLPYIYTSSSRRFEVVSIPADGYQVAGYLSVGTKANGPWLVFVHGNRKEGQSHVLYQRIANGIDDDVSVLSIDLRGFGASSGEGLERSVNILNRSGDIDAAVEYLHEGYGVTEDQILLAGHSLGALQVLKAAGSRRFLRVIPIGPANFEAFLTSQDRMEAYIEKFQYNTGVQLTPESMEREGSQLLPQQLFTPCPETPIVMVFASHDLGDGLDRHREKIPEDCISTIQWITIPFSDHMYGTEGSRLPRLFQPFHSNISVTLLISRLNRLLTAEL